ncbi:MAG: AraC family transcriptional regulator [Streptosporangiaceae bacterium]|jgi:AraC-like DNA-binding protein
MSAPQVFSTAGLPAARRIELWEGHNAAALIGLNCHSTTPLEASEVNVPAGRVQLARVTGSPHVVERGADRIARDPAGAVAVYLTLRGAAWFTDEDGTRELRPGQLLICDADRPFARGFAHGLEELAIKVPTTTFAQDPPGRRSPLGSPVVVSFGRGQDPYARALARMADRAARPRPQAAADEGAVLDLVAVLTGGGGAGRTAALRAAAYGYIEDHLADPALGAAQIAAATGISERHLSRVLAAGGTTVPSLVRSRRLEVAYGMLANGARPVAEIAARCGFTSAAYFSHAFRARFGLRASEVRRTPAR